MFGGVKMKKPELLAPVGSYESLIAAIEAGCDAVYLSGKKYGARVYANNFNDEELIEAIKYADVLVDGQFEYDKKDLSLAFRGSSNQRILELKNNEQLSI